MILRVIRLVLMLLVIFWCAALGWLLLFKTQGMVACVQKVYARSRLNRAMPFSSMVMKPWHPNYLRTCGVLVWLVGLWIAWLTITHKLVVFETLKP